MLLKCLQWRSDFGADGILDEELGFKEIEGVVAYMQGYCLLINIVIIMCMFSYCPVGTYENQEDKIFKKASVRKMLKNWICLELKRK